MELRNPKDPRRLSHQPGTSDHQCRQRRDHRVFIPLLERLLGTAELPQLVIKGNVLGSYHEILDMREMRVP